MWPLKANQVLLVVCQKILHKKKVADFLLSPKLGLGLSGVRFYPKFGVDCLCVRKGMLCYSPWKALR